MSAIILAAGAAARLGRFKPLVELGRSSPVKRVIDTFQSAGVSDIIVVAGHRAGELSEAVRPLGARIAVNDEFKSGMFSSVRAGLKALPPDVSAFFLLPVDIPLVRPATIHRLSEQFEAQGAQVCYPTFRGKRGHPPLISSELAEPILNWSGQGGLRAFLSQLEDRAVDAPVADAGILQDMDTPEDHAWMQGRVDHLSIPTEVECVALLSDVLAVPEPIRNHCRAVANVAASLTRSLNESGLNLDLGLVQAAALLHDIARVSSNHADRGAALLEEMGFPEVAGAVQSHMDLSWNGESQPGPKEVVFLADKLVIEDRPTSLEARFQNSLARFSDNPPATKAIRSRWRTAERIRDRIESITGRSLSGLLPETA